MAHTHIHTGTHILDIEESHYTAQTSLKPTAILLTLLPGAGLAGISHHATLFLILNKGAVRKR